MAQESFSIEELKVFLRVPSHEIVGHHIHKLVQVLGESLHITSEYLTHEAKIASAVSRVEALEAENSKLKKDIIVVMDEANTIKEKVKALGDDSRAERQVTQEKDE
ncbi:uncharacterized protein LOC115962880 [Quercus lobata]|uniref:uncharacterized protein LOC115962873 n=1 Tax=Quercus lobata TaxID=97700 RepID=UPI001246D327|nr:uncharacterized protein LOC115962873 [Quercus lobata]XP_030937620.1 uncharacterized protein LOC115962880 [Quercus lobata]